MEARGLGVVGMWTSFSDWWFGAKACALARGTNLIGDTAHPILATRVAGEYARCFTGTGALLGEKLERFDSSSSAPANFAVLRLLRAARRGLREAWSPASIVLVLIRGEALGVLGAAGFGSPTGAEVLAIEEIGLTLLGDFERAPIVIEPSQSIGAKGLGPLETLRVGLFGDRSPSRASCSS